jgi:hypothetical protein
MGDQERWPNWTVGRMLGTFAMIVGTFMRIRYGWGSFS